MKSRRIADYLFRGPAASYPLAWVPTLYLAKGLLVVLITCVTLVMGKRMGMSNTEAALCSSCLYLPFVLKPCSRMLFTTPLVRRWVILLAEVVTAFALFRGAGSLMGSNPFPATWIALFFVALSGAMHNMAVDDLFFYQLRKSQRKAWVGAGLFSYHLATIIGLGVLVMIAGNMEVLTRSMGESWAQVFFLGGVFYSVMACWHLFTVSSAEVVNVNSCLKWSQLKQATVSLWRKPHHWAAFVFILLYPTHESFLYRGSMLFMVDKGSIGGLSMGPQEVGFALGTVGAIAFMLGGILGKKAVAGWGLQRWLWPMALAFTLPDAVFVYMSFRMPDNVLLVSSLAFVEQLFSGFGMAAYLLFLIGFVQGSEKKIHYDVCMSVMAFGLMVCGMLIGWCQDYMGYRNFFIFVMMLTVITYVVTAFVHVGDHEDRHRDNEEQVNCPDGI